MKDIKLIPKGVYCYTQKNDKLYVCPYWSINKRRPYQDNGYCSFLKQGDWMVGFGLLWDQIKECGIN